MQKTDHILTLQVRNQPGVLVRVAHVFARRGCNIRSLHLQPHSDDRWSTMVISVNDATNIEQINQQLQKLVDVAQATVNTQHSLQEQKYS